MATVLNIHQAANKCQTLFKSCLANPEGRNCVPFFRSAQGDFNLWCSATQATALGISSLDHRLSSHENVKENVISLLQELTVLLGKSERLLDRECKPPSKSVLKVTR